MKKLIFNNKDILLSSLINENNDKENEDEIIEDKEIIFRNYILKIEKCYKTKQVKYIEDKIKANVEKSNNIVKPIKKIMILKGIFHKK